MKRKRLAYYLLVILVLVGTSLYSQGKSNPPNPRGNGNGPPPPPPQPGLSIDSGINYLLVAGVVYGVFVTRRKKKLVQ